MTDNKFCCVGSDFVNPKLVVTGDTFIDIRTKTVERKNGVSVESMKGIDVCSMLSLSPDELDVVVDDCRKSPVSPKKQKESGAFIGFGGEVSSCDT